MVRDRIISNWCFTEPKLNESRHAKNFGSGYPSDPICKEWLNQNKMDPIFVYPDVVRFSWGPIKKLLLNDTTSFVPVEFAADENDCDEPDDETHKVRLGIKRQQDQMSAFLGRQVADEKPKQLPFLEKRKLQPLMKL